jgi:hypothetical protein
MQLTNERLTTAAGIWRGLDGTLERNKRIRKTRAGLPCLRQTVFGLACLERDEITFGHILHS